MSALSEQSGLKGFTLVELLVVISIIAILAVVGVTVFSGVQKSARDGRRKADIKALSLALEQYKAQNGSYPVDGWYFSNSASSPWISGLGSSYITDVPKDPTNTAGCNGYESGCYAYSYFTSGNYGGGGIGGKYYALFARLENPSSSDLAKHCTFPDGSKMGGQNMPTCSTPGCLTFNYGNIVTTCNQL